ncbi:MAG: hypothetical protein ACE5G6_00010 [Terriglobia bacterium]
MRIPTLVALCGALALLAPPLASPAHAQQTQKRSEVELMPVEPPPEPLAPQPWGLYDLSLTLEFGHQQSVVKGNNDVYRSHLNYSDGFRVFNFNLRGQGRDGAFLSDFYLQGAGWGGDPSNWLRYGASKDKWFDFRATYRRNDYFWVFPGFARDQHTNDQQRRWQTYDLTLFPKQPVRVRLGYSRNSSFGFALTTQDFSRDEFLLFEPLRQTYDEYRGGVEWTIRPWNFFFEQSYRFLRNDRFLFLPDAFNPGNDPTDAAFLTDLERRQPIRARIPFTRFTIAGRPHPTLDVTARIVHSKVEIDATRFETAAGRTFLGADVQETLTSALDADRPYTVADASATWRPLPRLTLSNDFRFDQYDISSAGAFGEFEFFPLLGTSNIEQVDQLRQLNLRGFRNRFEGRYDFTRWLGARAGFTVHHRDVQVVELELEDGIVEEQEKKNFNLNTRSFLLGLHVRPRRTLSLFFDLERGNATGVFTRVSPNNFNRIRLRGRWEPVEGVKLNASWFVFENDNFNLPTSVELFGSDLDVNPDGRHSFRNRGVAVDLQLTRFQRAYLNLGYSRNDITSRTDVAFFNGFTFPLGFVPQGGESVYIANDNYAYLDFGGRLVGNLYGDAGYRVLFTTGTFPASDPLGVCDPLGSGSCAATALGPLEMNRGGLNFHQPHVALRYAFSDNLNWKAGWRWYGYNVKGGTLSDYKSHIVTTSLVLTF